MSDIKMFRLSDGEVSELASQSVQVEKSLQNLFEIHLEELLGVRFVASEYSTGPVHRGRIDTLGLDEDGAPVIIEYKRAVNINVINQGLFYLDWLMDYQKDFEWLVLNKLGPESAKTVDWLSPRLICVAGDFTRQDEHAVKQIPRHIELLRYRKFGDQLLMIELVHAPKSAKAIPATELSSTSETVGSKPGDPYATQRITYRLANAPPVVKDIYDALASYLSGLGDDVQVKELKYYIAFKRIKNFACIEVFPQAKTVTAYLKIDPSTLTIEPGFTRDVRNIGHYGTGDLEISIKFMDAFVKAQSLLQRAYEGG
jgi:predicted transport protein